MGPGRDRTQDPGQDLQSDMLLTTVRVATNISHWLKVHSRGSKNTYLQKSVF